MRPLQLLFPLNPELTKESVCACTFNKAGSYQTLQSSAANPFTPNLQYWIPLSNTHTHTYMPTHSLFFSQWPSSDLSSFVVDWETFLWVLKTKGAAWKSEAQARIAPNVNLNGGGEFRAWEALTHLLTERVRITQWPWSNHRLVLWRVKHMFFFQTHTWTWLLRVYVFKAMSTCFHHWSGL